MQIEYRDLGTMEYEACWQLQQELFDAMLARKRSAAAQDTHAGTLLLVEHLPVYTLGKSGKSENLLISESALEALAIIRLTTILTRNIKYLL